MRLSAPIYKLKRQAKMLSREAGIPLNKALNRVAQDEGFTSWSLLAVRISKTSPAINMLASLQPGDLILLGARPGEGKTMLGLELLIEAIKAGRQGVFYTLEYTDCDVLKCLQSIGAVPKTYQNALIVDTSDAICADYIMDQLQKVAHGSVVVVDYLQLLDQKREKAALTEQISALKVFASKAGVTIIFLSQIDRSYETSSKELPDLADVRLPNPLDLRFFTKTCFLSDGKVRFEAAL